MMRINHTQEHRTAEFGAGYIKLRGSRVSEKRKPRFALRATGGEI
jgi:hypothetical protein